MRTFVITALLMLLAFGAFAQVATVADPNELTYSATARGGQHAGFSVNAAASNVGVFARSLGSAWDVGAEGLIYRGVVQEGEGLALLDVGTVAIYGSRGAKIAGQGGLVFGDAGDCMFWAKGIVGNFQAITAGAQIGRVAISGAYGNYFENRGDVGVNLDQAGRYALTGGWSSALGWNGGVKISLARKKP